MVSKMCRMASILTGLPFAILVVPLHAAESTKTAPPFGALPQQHLERSQPVENRWEQGPPSSIRAVHPLAGSAGLMTIHEFATKHRNNSKSRSGWRESNGSGR